MYRAKCIALSRNLESYCGRLMAACPTRGGIVFADLVQLLCGRDVDGVSIALLPEKVQVIMTGKIKFENGTDVYDVMSNGQSWIQCDTACGV